MRVATDLEVKRLMIHFCPVLHLTDKPLKSGTKKMLPSEVSAESNKRKSRTD